MGDKCWAPGDTSSCLTAMQEVAFGLPKSRALTLNPKTP